MNSSAILRVNSNESVLKELMRKIRQINKMQTLKLINR